MSIRPTCPTCRQEVRDRVSCVLDVLIVGGRVYLPIRWGQKGASIRPRGRADCFGCGTPHGGIHHRGCDVEDCPACGRQAARCGCRTPLPGEERESARVALLRRGYCRALRKGSSRGPSGRPGGWPG
jgi:hypothetical protein